nr:FliH/SctL family protein [Thiorhodococcus mannitoliphagus]
MASSQSSRAHDVERWLPPDVGRATGPVIKPPTSEEIAAIEEAARLAGAEAGFREGYKTGYKEGADKAAEEARVEQDSRATREQAQRQEQDRILSETVAALEGVARELADPLASTADDLEPELLALVEAVARQVIMEELRIRPELVQQVLHQALKQLPSRQYALRVHVHPDQQAILERYAQERGEQVSWVPDREIEPGGCVLESGPSRIDASLEARLRQGIAAIWGDVSKPRQEIDAVDVSAEFEASMPDVAMTDPDPDPEPEPEPDPDPDPDPDLGPGPGPGPGPEPEPEPEPDESGEMALTSEDDAEQMQ